MKYLNGFIFVFVLALSAPAAKAESLYQQLGEQQGISALVEQMLFNIADDRRIRHHFEGSDLSRVHEMLTEQICDLSGGPCTYSGEDMETSHSGMGVTRSDFNALVENLQLAMDDLDVPTGTQNQLLALLAPMHHEIVE
ncbi:MULTISPECIES: group 1 truncated hemoglobin [Gammaproteobacteria]|uniref:group I truncated hemoglobin n=1 Tax=Gammaproteobacteria TaxID=1236 RepID=UPI000DCF745A|nr:MULTISPECIES: group 1 truncated hemoglobin [Gammaproteobacteria]RTE87437.1 group 1 truncated hemoglobin [Aliidiomarina sp. B3213]TCZ92778.1 group 1 truncated hemoglobin [Lysobacter sp. N42]